MDNYNKERLRWARTMNEAFGPYAELEIPRTKWERRWDAAVEIAGSIVLLAVFCALVVFGVTFVQYALGGGA